MTISSESTAADIAKAVAGGKLSALDATEAALARINRHNPVLNVFTDVTAERARARAKAIDADIVAGKTVGPLAGVPFAVKNLFDVQGLSTRAGSVSSGSANSSTRRASRSDTSRLARMAGLQASSIGNASACATASI